MNPPLGMITENKLLEAVGVTKSTLSIYLGRAEFSHIHKLRMGKNRFVYRGVTNKDIERLKAFRNRRAGVLYSSHI